MWLMDTPSLCLSIQNVPLLPEAIVDLNSNYYLSVSWDLDNEKLLKKHFHFSITQLLIMLSTPKKQRKKRSLYIKQLLELKTMRKFQLVLLFSHKFMEKSCPHPNLYLVSLCTC